MCGGDLRGSDPAEAGRLARRTLRGPRLRRPGAWRQWVDYPSTWMAPAACGCGWRSPGPAQRRDGRFRAAGRPTPGWGRARGHPLPVAPGRLRYRDEDGVTEASGRQLSLVTRDGLALAPMDFFLRLRGAAARRRPRASSSPASWICRCCRSWPGGLPFDPAFRARLAAWPRPARWRRPTSGGRWASAASPATRWMRASPAWASPGRGVAGFSGLSGRIEGSRGRALQPQQPRRQPRPAADLPGARLALAELAADGSWSHPDGSGGDLASASFANRDTRGSAAGRYRSQPRHAGRDRPAGPASPRPTPAPWRHAHGGRQGGPRLAGAQPGRRRAEDARLVLKGDLAKFPFRNPEGRHLPVTAGSPTACSTTPGAG